MQIKRKKRIGQRQFFSWLAAFSASSGSLVAAGPGTVGKEPGEAPERVVDFHQHTPFGGRSATALRRHQTALGVDRTVLLPAGSYGALGAGCGGNEPCQEVVDRWPEEFVRFANEAPDVPGAISVLRRELERGAVGIGEQKFRVRCDGEGMRAVAEVAREFGVPVLMHFEYGAYNFGFRKLHKLLEAFPEVNFIGHSYEWWGEIDAAHRSGEKLPQGRVLKRGYTDWLLANYGNVYGDLSGRAGLNALVRDRDYAAAFLERHQKRLLFGSDCADSVGRGPGCIGWQLLSKLRDLAGREVRGRIFCENAIGLLTGRENGWGQ